MNKEFVFNINSQKIVNDTQKASKTWEYHRDLIESQVNVHIGASCET